ncbi:sulfite exporter TauE/SafE family protein [Priestia megaterium]|uniref:sulfite exporter TauE/SafE family protein n=1 Tax=Priestia megaterium TaxID=1404 RepID=UPI000BA74BFE|nr:sulfite exporter TauE/SafE family protein [Priestia megaterium]PAK43176.1 hypothetical protein CHH47_28210 [Priestia megaterium]
MIEELILVLFILFVGSFIQGVSGFGFGLFSMGFLPLFLTLKDSTLLVLALTIAISLNILFRFFKCINWKNISVILIGALTGRIFSFYFLNTYGEMDWAKKTLGFLLIAMVLYLLTTKKETNSSMLYKNPLFTTIIGLIGGFIGGVFAVGGPFFTFYFLMRYKEKNHYNANLQASFIITNAFTLTLHGINGDYNSSFWFYLLPGLCIIWIGTNLGLRWFEHLPRERIKKLVSIIVLLSGLVLLTSS